VNDTGRVRRLGPWRLFCRDLGRVGRACRFDPRLPAVVLVVSLLGTVPGAIASHNRDLRWLGAVEVVAVVATLGVLGAERAWFVAADRREQFTWSEVRSVAGMVWFRYVRLGVCMFLLGAVVFVPVVLVAGLGQLALGGGDYDIAVRVAVVLTGFAVEIALTFATVVLVFSELTALDAIRHSVHVIRIEWPSSAWYTLAAPLTIQGLVLALPSSSVGLGVRLATLAIDAVVRLFCVGAVVLFWADRYMMVGIES
jgi:hypothetical protein